jgi:hypothetical protein
MEHIKIAVNIENYKTGTDTCLWVKYKVCNVKVFTNSKHFTSNS